MRPARETISFGGLAGKAHSLAATLSGTLLLAPTRARTRSLRRPQANRSRPTTVVVVVAEPKQVAARSLFARSPFQEPPKEEKSAIGIDFYGTLATSKEETETKTTTLTRAGGEWMEEEEEKKKEEEEEKR